MLSPTGISLASARHLLSGARRLAKRGLDISFLVPNHYYLSFDTAEYRYDEIIEGVKIKHGFLPKRWRGAIGTHFSPLGYWTWKLISRAMEEPFDIIHIMKPYYTSASAGLILHLITGKPVVLECDDLEGKRGLGTGLAEDPLLGFKVHLIDVYERLLPRLADAVIADTSSLTEMFRTYGVEDDRLFYVPYSVEEYMTKTGNGEKVRGNLAIGGNPVAIYCGALHPHFYDCDILIKAMAIVRGRIPEARMLIVGDGGARPELEQMAEDLGMLNKTITFTGWVPRRGYLPTQARSGSCSLK